MKHIIFLAMLSVVAACGTAQNKVTRSQPAPLGMFGISPDAGGTVSTRSSIDLLSFG